MTRTILAGALLLAIPAAVLASQYFIPLRTVGDDSRSIPFPPLFYGYGRNGNLPLERLIPRPLGLDRVRALPMLIAESVLVQPRPAAGLTVTPGCFRE